MKKILYYSLVDWAWIKQRPHFLALGLTRCGFDVRVIYQRRYRRKNLTRVDSDKILLRPIYRIPPLGYRFSAINRINQWIVRRKVWREIKEYQPDILWITHPSQLEDIPNEFAGKIIYDCMDDYDVLGTSTDCFESVCRQEQNLCDRADLIFVSSSLLQNKICSRNPNKINQMHLVRNGCDGKLYPRITGIRGNKLYAGYVGTIAEWFDFDLILESLERIPHLEYFLIGPVSVKNVPVHDRIHYIGTVAHKDLFDKIKEMDCMVMPFRLVDVVLSVDPVKLYEYISWQKNILTVSYPEIQRFGKFVWQYTNVDEYCAALIEIGNKENISYSEEEARNFLENNTWDKRIDVILEKIRSI